VRDPKKAHLWLSDFRKFAEQYGDVIGYDASNRAYIMTHGLSEIDWKHYKHPLPEHFYDVYMHYWKDHEFRSPKKILKNALEAECTSATSSNAQSYIFTVI
jgi:hypothetical protein